MALPPEPLEEILPEASIIVVAEVLEVLKQPAAAEGGSNRVGAQVVRLKVDRVLRGDTAEAAVLTVRKPEAGYALRAGNSGPFLLSGELGSLTILGRYGPDSWSLERIERALSC